MENLFRFFSILAIAISAFALTSQAGTETPVDSDDGAEVLTLRQQVDSLQKKVAGLEKAGVAGATGSSVDASRSAPSAIDFTNAAQVAQLEKLIDSRVDNRIAPAIEQAEKRIAETMKSTAADNVFVAAAPKMLTLKEAGKEIGLTEFDIEFLEERQEKTFREVGEMMLNEGETYEDLKALFEKAETDQMVQAQIAERFMTKVMAAGGIGKLVALKAKNDAAIKERFGEDKFKKYKAIEPRIEKPGGFGGGNFQMNMSMKGR